MTSYSAVVLYYRHGPSVADTLSRLLAQSSPPVEVVVVDNDSGDGVIEGLRAGFPTVRFLALAANVGYGGGMNRGQEALTVPVAWTLYLTHEVAMSPTCVEELIKAGEASVPRASAVGPRLYRGRSHELWSAGGRVTATGAVRHRSRVPDGASIDWLDGACVLVSDVVRAESGGWSEEFFLYWEDVEFSLRIASVGPVLCAEAAYAEQETATTPVYFAARNRLLCWRLRRKTLLLVASVVHLLGVLVVRDWLVNRDFVSARVRLVGMVHGFNGALDTDLGRVRETRRR